MKTLWSILLTAVSGVIMVSCDNASAGYVDLSTGEQVELVKDEETGRMVNKATGKPVKMYVDRRTNDTIWGSTGVVINGKVKQNDNGRWIYTGDDVTMKDGEFKIKHDDDGAYKEKGDDYKRKYDSDGDYKLKNGDVKVKYDAEDGKRKVKRDD
jgi:hypothetical protein